MKKQLRKPENWQDFETLCKILWGEIWEVPNKIKKNGRSGQVQYGVDIYAVPKGEDDYWGIQCKGKDEYTNAKLTLEEIDVEISKAQNFSPKLGVFIIATTANKDAVIEQYIRNKDLEHRKNGTFEILLYSWEDIVDLIENNRNTFNYYINKQQFKENYSFNVYFTNFKKEITIHPVCIKTIKRFKIKDTISDFYTGTNIELAKQLAVFKSKIPFQPNTPNYALRPIEIIMVNDGDKVIEDWSVSIYFEKKSFVKITDIVGSGPLWMPDFRLLNKDTCCEDNKIHFSPHQDKPLVQNTNRSFKAWIEPLAKDYEIKVLWTITARDYSSQGELKMLVSPKYEDNYIDVYVENEEDVRPDEIIGIKAKKYYPPDNDEIENEVRYRF